MLPFTHIIKKNPGSGLRRAGATVTPLRVHAGA
jgi:hypothetical protein